MVTYSISFEMVTASYFCVNCLTTDSIYTPVQAQLIVTGIIQTQGSQVHVCTGSGIRLFILYHRVASPVLVVKGLMDSSLKLIRWLEIPGEA